MKTLQGKIIGLHTGNTAKVSVTRQWQHPMYKKSVTRSKQYACQYNADQNLAVGDVVIIQESKPISKTKHFIVAEKVGGTE
ncbi:MAG: 30S ribosomal protein S17 [Patescibacteria group bacterium]